MICWNQVVVDHSYFLASLPWATTYITAPLIVINNVPLTRDDSGYESHALIEYERKAYIEAIDHIFLSYKWIALSFDKWIIDQILAVKGRSDNAINDSRSVWFDIQSTPLHHPADMKQMQLGLILNIECAFNTRNATYLCEQKYITPDFIGLGKDNCKTRRETIKFGDLVPLILDILRYIR